MLRATTEINQCSFYDAKLSENCDKPQKLIAQPKENTVVFNHLSVFSSKKPPS